uniref:Putative dna-directed rna polymerase i subunit rpa49 n=1 Tax=Rhodnius prolixus TaxID=13249 RepID=R4G870_RHOPR
MEMEHSSDMTTIDSYFTTSSTSPCLVSFEYGSLVKNEASNLRCNMYKDKKESIEQMLVVSKGNQCYKGKLNSNALCQTLLLVRNKRTNKARIFSAYSCLLQNALKERNQQKSIDSTSEKSDYVNDLNMVFGSRKAKRYSELSMRMKITNSISQDEAKQILAEMKGQAKDIIDLKASSEDAVLQLLPPCNRDATSPEDVYKAEDILSEMEMNSLDKAVSLLNDENEKKSEFCKRIIIKIDAEENTDKLKLLIYADSLLRFVNMGAIEIKNKNCLRKQWYQRRVIGTKILNDFTVLTGNTRNRPVSYKDKAVCYLMVLILLACNYKLNLELISSLLKGYHQKKLLQLCKTVGLVASTEGKQKVYMLKVPLPKLPALPFKKKQPF